MISHKRGKYLTRNNDVKSSPIALNLVVLLEGTQHDDLSAASAIEPMQKHRLQTVPDPPIRIQQSPSILLNETVTNQSEFFDYTIKRSQSAMKISKANTNLKTNEKNESRMAILS